MTHGKTTGRRLVTGATVLVVAGLALSACTSSQTSGKPSNSAVSLPSTSASSSASSVTAPSTSVAPSSSAATGAPVHIKLLEDDSSGVAGPYGVGMPIVAYFSKKITEAKDFTKATTITVNGQPNAGSWYFEASAIIPGYPIEGHYRPAPAPGATAPYWPAHATIHMTMNTDGVSAGAGMVFNDSLTLNMSTGAANISTVNCGSERMVVTSDGKVVHTMPTSCGAAKTPTYTGIKVVMQKGEDTPDTNTLRPEGAVQMIGTGSDHYDLIVPWSVRITQDGEYVHAASWNGGNIGKRSTSNGCTNLNTDDAKWFYNFAQIGDVLTYSNTKGTPMPSWDGFGDWNVPQAVWNTGGLVPTV